MSGVVARPGGRAGASAQRRYRQLRRAWRWRVRWWLLAAVATFAVVLAGPVGWALVTGHRGWAGLAVGGAAGLLVALWSSPPGYVENWSGGALGERWTGRELRRLPVGWVVLHDRWLGWGNLDHLVIGPGGVFALDTKNWPGQVTVTDDGALRVQRLEDPDLAWTDTGLLRQARGMGLRTSKALGRPDRRGVWAQPVLVMWGRFEQQHVHRDGVDVVAGRNLAAWLRAQPARLSPDRVAVVAAAARAGLRAATDHPEPDLGAGVSAGR